MKVRGRLGGGGGGGDAVLVSASRRCSTERISVLTKVTKTGIHLYTDRRIRITLRVPRPPDLCL